MENKLHRPGPGDVSSRSGATLRPSPAAAGDGLERCLWCRGGRRQRQRYCSKRCRQTAFRLRKRAGYASVGDAGDIGPMRFAYADPPYPGMAYLYKTEVTYRGEVDHPALIARLMGEYPDGWALSTSSKTLRLVLPLCPPGVRVCAWVKPIGASPLTYGLHSCWEPLIVCGGRKRRPGVRDWFSGQPARRHGKLIGRKPLSFCSFLFSVLGAGPGDTLDDLFPGTGVVGRAWLEFQRFAAGATVADAAVWTTDRNGGPYVANAIH
jgi:hypothetical protein